MSLVLLGACTAAHQSDGPTQPEAAERPESRLESDSQPTAPKPPCHQGQMKGDGSRVSLSELVDSPDRYVGQHIIVIGYVVDLYERSFLVDPVGGQSVWANWRQYDLRFCRRRQVVAEGIFRRAAPGVRHVYAIDIEGMRDVESTGR